MHRIVIDKLGPVDHCDLVCTHFMTFTGFQASGKSTIAKAIFYFRTIKDDILKLARMQVLSSGALNGNLKKAGLSGKNDLLTELRGSLQEKFLQTFGMSVDAQTGMRMEYFFSEDCSVKVCSNPYMEKTHDKSGDEEGDVIQIIFSKTLEDFLKEKNHCFSTTPLGVPENEEQQLRAELYELFKDELSVVYIPAGRSMLTILSQQLNYIYATMDDELKQSLDTCTRDYIERILKLKPQFLNESNGYLSRMKAYVEDLEAFYGTNILEKKEEARKIMEKVLRGTYQIRNGEEQIKLEDESYVKLNFASSGQQESVWILNLLYYYLPQKKKVLFIIEEPESHLFPESQKYITELIALVNNCGHEVVLTTHSPYVLGTLNNLLYAYTLKNSYSEAADQVISKSLWIDSREFGSWFVKNGIVENSMDPEIHMIQNERIDEISGVINRDFEELLELQNPDEKGGAA